MTPYLLKLAVLVTLSFASTAHALDSFRIGLLGGENAQDRLSRLSCLQEKVEAELGVPVKMFTPADYNGVLQGLLGGTIDMAGLGASGYAKVWLSDPQAIIPAVTRINKGGGFGYHSIAFARRDSGINSLADMRARVFGFGDPNSTSGYLIPAIEIPQLGYDMTPGVYFDDVKFTGGHEQTIIAVKNGSIDAGVVWSDGLGAWEDGHNSGALRKAVDAGLVDMNDFVEIWRSKPIPEGPMVFHRSLPEDIRERLTLMLLDMPKSDPECAYNVMAGEAEGYQRVSHENYDSIVEARRLKAAQ